MTKAVVTRAFQYRGGMLRPGTRIMLSASDRADAFVMSHVEIAEDSASDMRPAPYMGNGNAPGAPRTGVFAGLPPSAEPAAPTAGGATAAPAAPTAEKPPRTSRGK